MFITLRSNPTYKVLVFFLTLKYKTMVQPKDVPLKKEIPSETHLAETDANSVTEKSISKGSESEIPQSNPNAKTDSLGNNIEDSQDADDLGALNANAQDGDESDEDAAEEEDEDE